jgi:hypothetical protein
MRLGDLIATGHRVGRALAAALTMTFIIAVMLVLRCQNAADPFVGTGKETGTIVQVIEQTGTPALKGSGERKGYLGVIMLADSTHVEVPLPNPPPRVGDRVPLRYEHYTSGRRHYAFDHQEWLIRGP